MKKIKHFHELSIDADNDIDEIFKYIFKEFGLTQAVKYANEFIPIFKHLLLNPTI